MKPRDLPQFAFADDQLSQEAAAGPGPNPGHTASTSTEASSSLRPSYAGLAQGPPPFSYTTANFLGKLRAGDGGNTRPAVHTHIGPHHHHHHHHHVQSYAPQGSSTLGGGTAREGDRPGVYGNPSPPRRDTALGTGRSFGSGYGIFGGIRDIDVRDREVREREREREAGGDKDKKGSADNSPNTRLSAPVPSPYSRPSQSTSPTASRTLPSPSSAPPVTGDSMTTASPHTSSAIATGSASRPHLPTPGSMSLGSRSLPSPFDRDGRDRPATSDAASGPTQHNRSLSGSSNRGDTLPSLGGIGQTSPGKATSNAQASSANRNLYGGPAPLNQHERKLADAQRSPALSPSSAPKTATSASAAGSNTGNGAGRAGFSTYSSYAPPYLGFGSSYGGFGTFSGSWAERDRQRRQRELEKERMDRDREETERKRRAAMPSTAAGGITTSSASTRIGYNHPYRPGQGYSRAVPPPSNAQPRIEVLNAPSPDHPSTQAQYGHGGDAAMQQVAPSREPRPYTYSAKNELASAAASAREREYHYTPRDKRTRMDAAVEDQANRRGSVSKSRRKKDDDKLKSPVQPSHGAFLPAQVRDFSALTKEVRHWPEVNSSAVEAWLKTVPESSQVVSRQVYGGSGWNLARTSSTAPSNQGGIVTVRINGTFIGQSWVIRGEQGWDEATTDPIFETELGRGYKTRKIWGTDVYTDDSDLGLVLLHAGWIRWARPSASTDDTKALSATVMIEEEAIEVTVRMVPPLVRYTATKRNGLQTRGWGNGHDGVSIVVEGVQRISVGHKTLKGRTSRKLRLAELAQQRAVLYPLSDNERVLNQTDSRLIFVQGAAAHKYDPADMEGYLAQAGEDEEFERHSLWTRDLELGNSVDRYRLSLLPPDELGSTRLHVVQLVPAVKRKLNGRKGEVVKVLATDVPPHEVHFLPQGLAVRIRGEKGILCSIEAYRWRERSDELDTMAEDASDDGKVIAEDGAEDDADENQVAEVASSIGELISVA